MTTVRGGDGRPAPGGLGRAAALAGAWRWRIFWSVLTSPPLSQVVSQLPVGPESRETLFLAEQPPLPPSLTNGTAVPAAKPLPTLIKVQTPSPLLPPAPMPRQLPCGHSVGRGAHPLLTIRDQQRSPQGYRQPPHSLCSRWLWSWPRCTERRAGCCSCPPHPRPHETVRGSSHEAVGPWSLASRAGSSSSFSFSKF